MHDDAADRYAPPEIEMPPWEQSGNHFGNQTGSQTGNESGNKSGVIAPTNRAEARRLSELQGMRDFGDMMTPAQRAELRELEKPDWMRTITTLDVELATPREPICERIEGLTSCKGNTLIYGAYKSGKTTLGLNLLRSLVDGDPFLDSFDVEPLDGRVLYLNYELMQGMFDQWVVDHRLRATDRVVHLPLRGRGAFLTEEWVIDYLTEAALKFDVKAVIIDNVLASIAPGEDPNQRTVAAHYTSTIDGFKIDAGIEDVFLLAHTGQTNATSRSGVPLNSRAAHSAHFMGWPDDYIGWLSGKDPQQRYLAPQDGRVSAYAEPMPVLFHPETRRVSVDPSAARTWEAEETLDLRSAVKEFLRSNPRSSTRAVREGVDGDNNKIDDILDELVLSLEAVREKGPRNARLHSLADPTVLESEW